MSGVQKARWWRHFRLRGGCDPHKYIHPKCGGYSTSEVQQAEPTSLWCNNCKASCLPSYFKPFLTSSLNHFIWWKLVEFMCRLFISFSFIIVVGVTSSSTNSPGLLKGAEVYLIWENKSVNRNIFKARRYLSFNNVLRLYPTRIKPQLNFK